METRFAKWLKRRGESHSAYAIRMKVSRSCIAHLAGVARTAKPPSRFNYKTLVLVSKDTGIPIETLVSETLKAAENPIAPRRYTRKDEQNGKEAAE